ncbi:DUF4181 domain-containing protein [Bacillus sp. Marseille-Q1617]|uniref:DUF4181 domain-containing protein n=1 Tax=Bacillus sp. Marseille-Q1617 TaxID=2736887 RepID=UPI00158CF084|nr:DUF4181 domain-containing protein [Bacillus sp. Marseille-Q1617]
MFWIKFSIIVMIVFILISIVKLVLRKSFRIEKVKKDWFSYNYINDLHGKIDKWIRITTTITLLGLSWFLLFYNEDLMYFYLFAVVFFMVVDYGVRAFFEWKQSDHPKQAILTLAEMLIIVTAIFVVFQIGLLGT